MSTLLERLVAADPEHFGYGSGLLDGPCGIQIYDREPLSWELAGWCLEQMVVRYREFGTPHCVIFEGSGEYVILGNALYKPLCQLTPESIIEAYCDWKESLKKVSV